MNAWCTEVTPQFEEMYETHLVALRAREDPKARQLALIAFAEKGDVTLRTAKDKAVSLGPLSDDGGFHQELVTFFGDAALAFRQAARDIGGLAPYQPDFEARVMTATASTVHAIDVLAKLRGQPDDSYAFEEAEDCWPLRSSLGDRPPSSNDAPPLPW